MISIGRARAASIGIVLVAQVALLAGWHPGVGSSPADAYSGPSPATFTMPAHSSTRDLRTLPPPAVDRQHLRERPEREAPGAANGPSGDLAPIGSATDVSGSAPAPGLTASFEGLAFNDSCGGTQCGDGHPPDTNPGAGGP